MELYLHSSLRLLGVVLNCLSTGKMLPLHVKITTNLGFDLYPLSDSPSLWFIHGGWYMNSPHSGTQTHSKSNFTFRVKDVVVFLCYGNSSWSKFFLFLSCNMHYFFLSISFLSPVEFCCLCFECPHSFVSQLAHCLETLSRLFFLVRSYSVCRHVGHGDASPATGAPRSV